MLRLAFDFIITWRETRTRPNAYRYTAFCMEYRHKVEYLGGKMRRIHKNHIPTRIEKCYSVLFIKKSTDYRYL